MTSSSDPFIEDRAPLVAEVRRVIAAMPHSHRDVLKDKLAPVLEAPNDAPDLLPGLLCLLSARTLGAEETAAMPSAVALTLFGGMGRVFGEIARQPVVAGADPLPWGLPRSLNSGDGFYSLAYETLLKEGAVPVAVQGEATAVLGEACRQYSEELYVAFDNRTDVQTPSRALIDAALELAELVSGTRRESLDADSGRQLTEATEYMTSAVRG